MATRSIAARRKRQLEAQRRLRLTAALGQTFRPSSTFSYVRRGREVYVREDRPGYLTRSLLWGPMLRVPKGESDAT